MTLHYQLFNSRNLNLVRILQYRYLVLPNQLKSFHAFPVLRLQSNVKNSQTQGLKPFLPEEYHCFQAWQRRLDSPIMEKVELDDFFYQVDKKYQPDKVISPIDVDIFVNKVTDEENLEEVEELIHRLRKSPSVSDTLPSTGHAVIRILIALDKIETLFRILNDRMNYGVFLDFYTANLLMDKFLSSGNLTGAAKVASLLMLEEDFGPSTTKFFALLSCLKYLENSTAEPWESVPEVEESKDEVKIRVRFLRNPFFDDHFELTNTQHIIGKTLALLSFQVEEDEVMRNSIEVLGWALYDKWDKVERCLNTLVNKKQPITVEVLSKVKTLAEARITEIEATPNKSLPKPKLQQVIGMNLEPVEVSELFARLKWDEQTVIPVSVVVNLLSTSKFITVDVNLISRGTELLTKAINELTSTEITEMSQTYENWEEIRMEELSKQILRYKEIQTLLEIQQTKKDLKEREDTIFFFDHEEEWMMKLENETVETTTKVQTSLLSPSKSKKQQTLPFGKKAKVSKEDDQNYVSPII